MVRRRGLLRTAGRAAVISGAATAASGRVARRQQQQFAGRASSAVQPSAPTVASGSSTGERLIADLQQLAELHASGALSKKEFAAVKAKLLAD